VKKDGCDRVDDWDRICGIDYISISDKGGKGI
jgi:hypothetical protein